MFLLKILFYIALPIASLIYFYFHKKFSYFEKRGIPHQKPKFPMGNLQGLGSKFTFFDIIHDIYKKFKDKDVIVGLYSVVTPIYLITDIELAKNILIRDFNFFINRRGYVNEEDEPLTAHLFNLMDDKWKFLRNKLSPVFTSGKMKSMYYTISDKGQNYLAIVDKAMRQNESINIKEITNRFTVDIISSVAFGMNANTMNDEHPELLRFFKEIFNAEGFSFAKMFFMMAFPKIAQKLKMKIFSKEMSDFFMNVVSNNIENRERTNDNRHDFLNMLIQLKNKGSIDGEFSTEHRKITLNEALAQSFVFYFGNLKMTLKILMICSCKIS
ncbi:hypothetical protein PVAND_000060 [Polypedilum vanderplanki]|uniref:Cytochrome P450 n=1 Tax=Polypedilum vanderplanki TaxID=319348 RepID=A0A9J6BK60_POLVA|nr:hypothetical protein PVAND_000060 [Polypedilum vanderplanki]